MIWINYIVDYSFYVVSTFEHSRSRHIISHYTHLLSRSISSILSYPLTRKKKNPF